MSVALPVVNTTDYCSQLTDRYLETLGLRLDLHGVALSYLALLARRVLALIGQLRVVLLAHLAVAQALNLLQVLVLPTD